MSPSQRNCYKNVKVRTVVWLVYLFLTTSPIGAVWERNHYYRLEEDLLSNYSPTVRPVLDVNTVTNVSISFLVLCVYEVDEMVQAMTQNSYMALTWFDELLQWDPQEYGGVASTEFSSQKVWLPFMEILNTASGSWIVSIDDMSRVIVKANGHVTWFHQDVWTTICHMDITYFPFDTQQCNFSVSMWTSSKSQVQFVHIDPRQEEGYFIENSEWSLLSLKAAIREAPYDNTSYSSFTVTFYLKRRRVFHTLTLIVPNVILALLASLVFLLPVDTGEKMSFIMGLLLATGVSITVLMDIMPRSSLNLSFLMIYITALRYVRVLNVDVPLFVSSMTTALAVVASAYIIYCCSLDGPVGAKTTRLVKFMLKLSGKDLHFFKSRAEHFQHLEVHDCGEASPTYEDYIEHNDVGARDNLRDTKGDNFTSNNTAAGKDNQVKITWVDVASALNLVCFRITISVVVGMTVILIIVLLLGSS